MLDAPFTLGRSRRLIAAFVLLLLLPAATIVWLGVSLVIQDRALEADQLGKRQRSTAEAVVEDLNERLSAIERDLSSRQPPGDDAVLFVLRAAGIDTVPPTRLIFYPGLDSWNVEPSAEFGPGEELEHQKRDLVAAEAAFRKLTGHPSPDVRAGALIRVARVLRNKGRHEDALRVYDELARVTDASVDGVPATLAARRARCLVLDRLKDTVRLREEAAALQADLLDGAWRIDRGTFERYHAELGAWLGSEASVPEMKLALAEAAEWLWKRRGTSARSALRFAGVDLTVLWRLEGGDTLALVAGPMYQQRHWFSRLSRGLAGQGDLQVALASAGDIVSGDTRGDHGEGLRRSAIETGLPWDVVVSPTGSSSVGSGRRRTIVAGLGFLVLLVVAGGYMIGRAVSRELAVARLQSDFVTSVSHEFRTPLTSLRQFTDLLNEAEDLPRDKRRTFYAAQARATERLQRLVESLLDFRRMDAGTHPYQLRALPVASFVEGVVEDFKPEATARGFNIEYANAATDRTIEADPEALSLALWNLLDNAVKYSGDSRTVWVSMAKQNGSVAVSVRDGGLGVPQEEQQEIFRKFVRGRDARVRNIKGTGIGLAMVEHIVEGHGGSVTVDSEPGEGSTFTIVLPAAE